MVLYMVFTGRKITVSIVIYKTYSKIFLSGYPDFITLILLNLHKYGEVI